MRAVLVAIVTVCASLTSVVVGQDRFVIESMGWSCQPPDGWERVTGPTLEAIRSDIRRGPNGEDVLACWASGSQGALPRIIVSAEEQTVASLEQAAAMAALLQGDIAEAEPTKFSLTSGLASFDGEVSVLTEGVIGSTGVVRVTAYARDEHRETALQAITAMIDSAAFERGFPAAEEPNAEPAAASQGAGGGRLVGWGLRGAVIGAMIAVIVFGARVLRELWRPKPEDG